MKVTYIHGLIYNANSKKVSWLNKNHTVYAPVINYTNERNTIYNELLNNQSVIQSDIIIGSSLGGHLAFWLGQKLDKKVILFNPSLEKNKVLKPVIPQIRIKTNSKKVNVFLGIKDEVIDYNVTRNWLINKKVICNYEFYNVGHRFSTEQFISIAKKYIR